ncbi:MAG TPA: DUF58 domain-containing protein [Chloroflexota bacterium]|nr:DUF58 domain-containing protein [Chloroflexota bacterium]
MMDSPEARATSTPPWLFDRQGLALATFVMIVAAALRAADITFLAAALLLVGLAAHAWAKLAFVRLTYTRRTSTSRAFCGDQVQLESTLANPGPLLLPWLEIWERLPAALGPVGPNERSYVDPERVWVNRGVGLWPYQRLRWRRQLNCRTRGVFRLGEVCLRTGDPFGFVERERSSDDAAELLVYPRIVPLRRLALPLRHPALDIASPRSPVADPTRTATVRDYQPDDARRMIHWPTSARRGSLQVRVLEPATSLHASLVLDVRGFTFGAYRLELLELTLSALASIAVLLQNQGSPLALLANTDPPLLIPPGASVAQLQQVLEGLARLQPRAGPSLVPWAFDHVRRGNSVILATSDAVDGFEQTLQRFTAAGLSTQLLLARAVDARPTAAQALVLTPGCDVTAVLEGRA